MNAKRILEKPALPEGNPLPVLKPHEKTIIELLTAQVLSEEMRKSVFEEATLVSFEETGCGYFLTLAHPKLPTDRTVCNEPTVLGLAQDVASAFIIFLQDKELTIECYNASERDVFPGYRELDVKITTS